MVEILVIPYKQDKNIKETYHKKEMFYVPVFIHLWPGYPQDQTYCRPSKSAQKNSYPTLEIRRDNVVFYPTFQIAS